MLFCTAKVEVPQFTTQQSPCAAGTGSVSENAVREHSIGLKGNVLSTDVHNTNNITIGCHYNMV